MTETTTEPTTSTETDLDVLVRGAVDLVNSGSLTMADLLKALSPKQTTAEQPAVIPTAKPITDAQRAAIDRLPEVYGRVVPTERRVLAPTEVTALVHERETLDEIGKMVTARVEDIKSTAHNHLDVEIEASLGEDETPPLRDKHGHYIVAGVVGSPEVDKAFIRDTKQYAASLDEAALKALVDSGDLDHKDYLAMTRQVRVLDEARVLDTLRKKPDLVRAIAQATIPGRTGTAMGFRKRK